MGLIYPRDLSAWRAWQDSRVPLSRRIRHRLTVEASPTGVLTVSGERPRVLVVLDSLGPTGRAALLQPVRHVSGPVAVLAPAPLPGVGPAGTALEVRHNRVPDALADIGIVVAIGHFLPLGSAAYTWSRLLGAEFVVVQHGLLTAYVPPLPPDSHLLAWSMHDAEFWRAGRGDIQSEVVGSQLLWEAGTDSAEVVDDRPTFLGQLHGAEVGRRAMARFTGSFVREERLRYRPHPSETDLLSRWQHALWRRRGMVFEQSGLPLRDLPTPVVSVFSTGVLEAAARGVPAWVAFDRPAPWLVEFWERYGMSRYGGPPTPAPPRPSAEPAALVAAAWEGRG